MVPLVGESRLGGFAFLASEDVRRRGRGVVAGARPWSDETGRR